MVLVTWKQQQDGSPPVIDLPPNQQCFSVLPDPTKPLASEWVGSLQDQFSYQAKRVPQRIAVVDKRQAWSYSELEEISNQLAHYLRSCGLQPQDSVAIYAHRSAALVTALLGILKAGAAFVILDSQYPASRLINCLHLTMPRGWLQLEGAGEISQELEEVVSSLQCSRLTLPSDIAAARCLLKNYPTDSIGEEVGPDDLAYIAFTSGSTGKPKGILGTHRPLSHFVSWHTQTFDLRESDRFSMLSGLAHDPLLRDIFTPLSLGATLHIPGQEKLLDPQWLANWMQQSDISVAHLTPAMGSLLAGESVAARGSGEKSKQTRLLSQLRYAFFGGDVLKRNDVVAMRELAPHITCVNFYGATETPQAQGYYSVPDQKEDRSQGILEDISIPVQIPLGRGINNVQLLVLNTSLQLAGIGELGEIYIRSPYLARGYLEDEALTEQRFVTNPFTNLTGDRLYKTGDRVDTIQMGRFQSRVVPISK